MSASTSLCVSGPTKSMNNNKNKYQSGQKNHFGKNLIGDDLLPPPFISPEWSATYTSGTFIPPRSYTATGKPAPLGPTAISLGDGKLSNQKLYPVYSKPVPTITASPSAVHFFKKWQKENSKQTPRNLASIFASVLHTLKKQSGLLGCNKTSV